MRNENLDYDELLVRLGQLIADQSRRGEGTANQITQDEAPKRSRLGPDAPAAPERGLGVEPL